MKKPIIGVVPLWDDAKQSFWMLPGYLDGIKAAGGLPLTLPLTDSASDIKQLTEACDGFLFTGGQDVSPELYGEKKKYNNIKCCEMRDKTELLLLKEALSADKPILGICRGIQFINAALGGTLYQDIPSEVNSQTTHCQKPPYNIPIHKVKLIKGTPLYALLQKESLNVNSYHHQAVKKIAPSACKAAEAEDGITEALYVPGKKFVWAVQWHPEFSFHTDSDSLKIFEEFVSKCIP